MNTTNYPVNVDRYGQILLSYVEMCYAVAFALTRHPNRAEDIARYVLLRAWRVRDNMDSPESIKQNLLTALRQRFLAHYCQSTCASKNLAADQKCTAGIELERKPDNAASSLGTPNVARATQDTRHLRTLYKELEAFSPKTSGRSPFTPVRL